MTDLERALAELARELAVPAPPDLVPGVLGALERPRKRRTPRRWAVAVALAVLAALAATLAIPDARSALLRVLHIGGEQIEFVDELPPVTAPAGLDVAGALGERVSLPEARRRAGFDLLELEEAPDRVYLGPRGTVWFLYGEPDSVRLLVAQTPRLGVDEEFILKKLVASGTRVETATVRGASAFFLTGEPHLVLLVDEFGEPVWESARLVRNVLLWEEDDLTVRLEGDFTLDEALEVAASLR